MNNEDSRISPSSCLEMRLDMREYVRDLEMPDADKRRPRGCQFHTVSYQNKVQTYQFDENISN